MGVHQGCRGSQPKLSQLTQVAFTTDLPSGWSCSSGGADTELRTAHGATHHPWGPFGQWQTSRECPGFLRWGHAGALRKCRGVFPLPWGWKRATQRLWCSIMRSWPVTVYAVEMGLSPHTVRNHSTNLRRKLDVRLSLEAVIAAVRLGVLTLDEDRRETNVS